MNDDLNTPVALPEVFAAAQELNRALDRADRAAGDAAAQEAARADAALFRALLLGEFLDVLGLDPALAREDAPAGAAAADALAPKLIELLLAIRQDARKRKLFDLADRIRDDLATLGVAVEDTPQGPVWKRKD
jgi:cysteinyl-tRNA synthetase